MYLKCFDCLDVTSSVAIRNENLNELTLLWLSLRWIFYKNMSILYSLVPTKDTADLFHFFARG